MNEEMITRTYVAGHVAGAFARTGSASKWELIGRAQDTEARREVIEALLNLPDRNYANLRELWAILPDMPIE